MSHRGQNAKQMQFIGRADRIIGIIMTHLPNYTSRFRFVATSINTLSRAPTLHVFLMHTTFVH
jgi:hypothetical protein